MIEFNKNINMKQYINTSTKEVCAELEDFAKPPLGGDIVGDFAGLAGTSGETGDMNAYAALLFVKTGIRPWATRESNTGIRSNRAPGWTIVL